MSVVASRRRCIRTLALPTDRIVSSDASVGPRTVTSGEKQQSSDCRTSIDEHTPPAGQSAFALSGSTLCRSGKAPGARS
jgi:hypothetical protein